MNCFRWTKETVDSQLEAKTVEKQFYAKIGNSALLFECKNNAKENSDWFSMNFYHWMIKTDR